MSKQIQVSQLLATPDAQYINGEVSGLLTNIRPPNGRGPSKAKLQDPTGSIEVSLWGGGVSHWEGKYVLFSGKGMQIKEFRGTKQLSVGDKVVIGQAVEPEERPTEADFRSMAPTAPAPQPPRHSQQNRPAVPPGGLPVNIPNGQTIGMATKAAVDIWLKTHAEQGGAWDAAAISFCFGVANQIIGISRRLEKHAEESAADESVPF